MQDEIYAKDHDSSYSWSLDLIFDLGILPPMKYYIL